MRTLAITVALAIAMASAAQAQGRRNRNDKAPKVGDDAPDFKAKKIGKKEFVELKKLVEKEEKPVVLIFGSIT